ncbi:hypothetical protein [Paenibacillus sedimenti]|uniref:Uncharacterized protein n=1 Tax=Paenibacillus sedimenti TaxID=2770274 RepID=A0A926KQY9_9BACL|nr:hypothetical protein [Paenibacillus sedimenti]MBD0382457.1 hypothetical protein [Paenibacillus sedimenti]
MKKAGLHQDWHVSCQLDAYKMAYRKKMNELHQMKRHIQIKQEHIDARMKEIGQKQQLTLHLEQERESIRAQAAALSTGTTYEQEYDARQQYYKLSRSLANDSELYLQHLASATYKGIVVSPDTLPFKHNRIQQLLLSLSREGYLIFEFRTSDSEFKLQQLHSNYYTFSDEAFMLGILEVLQDEPIILCSWVLQCAWYDLLPNRKIWYDICDSPDRLWGSNKAAQLKHWDLLSHSEWISYADESYKHLTYYRKDAHFIAFGNEERSAEWIKGSRKVEQNKSFTA